MHGQRRRVVTPLSQNPLQPQTVHRGAVGDYQIKQRRNRRSEELVAAIARMDAEIDPATRKELADWIQDRYNERAGGELLGLFARCHLGPPFVDHELSLAGHILRHYKPDDSVPPAFAPARPLVRSTAYLYVEVYSDGEIVPIRNDGTPAN